ncbi:MAG: DUF5519 family protein [Thaumarchaeota archaeon]|nr:DUF5519 family protein [Nitrososphaerota archaeon]
MSARKALEKIVKEVAKWPGVTTHAHRFGGTEFRLGRRELGHVHGDYQADVPFPMDVRNQLVAEGRAEPHHVLPESGWITLRFRNSNDVESAISLFQLSYDLARRRTTPAGESKP